MFIAVLFSINLVDFVHTVLILCTEKRLYKMFVKRNCGFA